MYSQVQWQGWANHGMDHFPFLLIKLKFQWAIISKFKATFSIHKLIPKNSQMTTLYILIGYCTSLLPWFIILDKNNSVNVSDHYLTSEGYQVWLYPMSYGLIGMYWVKCKQTQV